MREALDMVRTIALPIISLCGFGLLG
jgi:hypothetical protein